MQMYVTTDYAVCFLLCMGNTEGPIPGAAVAEKAKIPPDYILKIALRLREGGMIGAVAGAKGGYYLKRNLDRISLLEVLLLVVPTVKTNRCLETDAKCSKGASDFCKIRSYYRLIQKELEVEWFSRTLEEILCRTENHHENMTEKEGRIQ